MAKNPGGKSKEAMIKLQYVPSLFTDPTKAVYLA